MSSPMSFLVGQLEPQWEHGFWVVVCGQVELLGMQRSLGQPVSSSRACFLQVWYAASYAEFVNQKIHDISEEERKGGYAF